jgi:hypothetical protein
MGDSDLTIARSASCVFRFYMGDATKETLLQPGTHFKLRNYVPFARWVKRNIEKEMLS